MLAELTKMGTSWEEVEIRHPEDSGWRSMVAGQWMNRNKKNVKTVLRRHKIYVLE